MFGFKPNIGNLIRADQLNADLPTFNLMGTKMSRTNSHKIELGIVELRGRTGRVTQSDARHKCPNSRGALQQFGMVQQSSLS